MTSTLEILPWVARAFEHFLKQFETGQALATAIQKPRHTGTVSGVALYRFQIPAPAFRVGDHAEQYDQALVVSSQV